MYLIHQIQKYLTPDNILMNLALLAMLMIINRTYRSYQNILMDPTLLKELRQHIHTIYKFKCMVTKYIYG
jgi:hypothetical protein